MALAPGIGSPLDRPSLHLLTGEKHACFRASALSSVLNAKSVELAAFLKGGVKDGWGANLLLSCLFNDHSPSIPSVGKLWSCVPSCSEAWLGLFQSLRLWCLFHFLWALRHCFFRSEHSLSMPVLVNFMNRFVGE